MSVKKVLILSLAVVFVLSSMGIVHGTEIIEVTSVRTVPNPATVKYPPGDSVYNNVWTRLMKVNWE